MIISVKALLLCSRVRLLRMIRTEYSVHDIRQIIEIFTMNSRGLIKRMSLHSQTSLAVKNA